MWFHSRHDDDAPVATQIADQLGGGLEGIDCVQVRVESEAARRLLHGDLADEDLHLLGPHRLLR